MRSRQGLWWTLVVLFLGLMCAPLSAHPLGNFTINHLARLRLDGASLRVHYVLDIAEIPSFQIMHAAGTRGDWNTERLTEWANSEARVVGDGFTLKIDGIKAIRREAEPPHAHTRSGAGGLPTLYWTQDFIYALGPGSHSISVTDNVYSQRSIGWRDIAVGDRTDPTASLTSYPSAQIASPRHVDRVSFTANDRGAISGLIVAESHPPESSSASVVRSNALSDLFSSSNRAPLFVAFTMLVAFGLGALHALEPGHGKALLAFTLVGSRATVKQAGILALSLTFAHTIGVVILGIVLFFAADFVSESIYPWITLVSGIAVAVIGARNLARYVGRRHLFGATHYHPHTSDHHHGSDDEHGHSHAIPGSSPIDFRAAIVAAMSGGVAPCPAAIVVMLAALRLHQIGYGLLLIVIFSVGLAAVLTGLGIAVVHGTKLVTRSPRFERVVAIGPLLSAVVISIVGAVMVAQGMIAQAVHASTWAIAAVTLLAIAGYAISASHSHAHEVEHA